MLLDRLLVLMALWRGAFARVRSFERATSVLIGLLCASGRRTVSAALCFEGRAHCEWSADYRVFNRAPWDHRDLFAGVLSAGLRYVPDDGWIVMHLDDTSVKKSSRVITQAGWIRDPLSPPFHVNLRHGLRFVHAALNLPLHREGHSARAVSVAFELAPPAKKPRRNASTEAWEAYRKQQKALKLTTRGVEVMRDQRVRLDALGFGDRQLLFVVDGSYTNRVVFCDLPERVDIIGRTRKDIALYEPAAPGGRRVYGERLPTPEQMRKEESRPYKTTHCHYGGDLRKVRYKEVSNILWKGGARRRRLRLLIIAPTPYRAPGPGRRVAYRDPAYLLTTDLVAPAKDLIQAYLDRWQIEVLHRDLKTGIGVGQQQVWSNEAVTRLHSALVAAYSMLTIATLDTYGPERTAAFPPPPAWRTNTKTRRASQHDIITMLRNDLARYGPLRTQEGSETPPLPSQWALPPRETYAAA